MEYWGGPFIDASPKEIARSLIILYSNSLKVYVDPEFGIDRKSIPFYGCIKIQWVPELIISIEEDTRIENFDKQTFIDELTEELKPLLNLLPFI